MAIPLDMIFESIMQEMDPEQVGKLISAAYVDQNKPKQDLTKPKVEPGLEGTYGTSVLGNAGKLLGA